MLHMLPIYTLGTEHSDITPGAHDALVVKCGWSKDEQERALNLWACCFSPQDRIKYIRKNRPQFEFHDYRQMVDVVRGRCFTGCASDLVNWRRQFRVRAWRIALLFCVATWIAIALAVIRAAS
ncbi:hypothetical protein [Bradyrhizobium sp. BR 1432]|uniref:hypothetical protein n=1 Tax=Bradyrhizobium sp. BR 1432 TaxID=3447966 RepID=UPI003EE69BBC